MTDDTDYRAALNALLQREVGHLFGRPVRFRYFQRRRGPMFCWTVEDLNGFYESYVYAPRGKGSRSGKAQEWLIDPKLTMKHKLRKDAKARALKLFREWEASSL